MKDDPMFIMTVSFAPCIISLVLVFILRLTNIIPNNPLTLYSTSITCYVFSFIILLLICKLKQMYSISFKNNRLHLNKNFLNNA